MTRPLLVTLAVALALLVAPAGCAGWFARTEGLYVSTLPASVRPDYDVFAQRCSKCHSLARPLSSGIDEDAYWVMYVEKMRRQPQSGISPEDTVPILRFLHYFSLEQRKKKAGHGESAAPVASPPPPSPSPTPVSVGTTVERVF